MIIPSFVLKTNIFTGFEDTYSFSSNDELIEKSIFTLVKKDISIQGLSFNQEHLDVLSVILQKIIDEEENSVLIKPIEIINRLGKNRNGIEYDRVEHILKRLCSTVIIEKTNEDTLIYPMISEAKLNSQLIRVDLNSNFINLIKNYPLIKLENNVKFKKHKNICSFIMKYCLSNASGVEHKISYDKLYKLLSMDELIKRESVKRNYILDSIEEIKNTNILKKIHFDNDILYFEHDIKNVVRQQFSLNEDEFTIEEKNNANANRKLSL